MDGVKIHLSDERTTAAALLIPDKERPLFHITTEANDQQTADRLAIDYEKKVVKWRDEE